MKRKSYALPAALIMATVLAVSLLLLLQLSFAPGNLYPPYSTLRTDPLGASALLESLQSMPGQKVSRNYQLLSRMAQQDGATLVELGGDFDDSIMQSPRNYALIEALLAQGSRLVILSAPVVGSLPVPKKKVEPKKDETEADADASKESSPPDEAEPELKEEKEEAENKKANFDNISLCAEWGFALEYLPIAEEPSPNSHKKSSGEEALPEYDSGFDQPLHWSSHLVFRNLDPAWKVLYHKQGKPVLIERIYGKGSIVLGSDAYFVSNEALRSDRRTDLILRVLGPHPTIIFSETQHGLYESTGMVGLLRRYQLHGTFACLFFLAILFVWRSMFSLIPAKDAGVDPEGSTAGPSAREGLTQLLHRNLTVLQALQEGVDRWLKTSGKKVSEATRLQAHDYLFDLRSGKKFNHRDIAGAYKHLQTMLTERK